MHGSISDGNCAQDRQKDAPCINTWRWQRRSRLPKIVAVELASESDISATKPVLIGECL